MDLEEIRKIIELMNEHGLSYVNLEEEGRRIKLKKGSDLDAIQHALNHAVAAPLTTGSPPPATPAGPPSTPAPAAGSDTGTGDFVEITSPMVGTFYRAASPESGPLVEVGDKVKKDTVVCIIESMKVMNEIQAETVGVITEILASNTDPVQYGEPLFRVKPD